MSEPSTPPVVPSGRVRHRRAGLIGAVVGVAAAGIAAGVAAERVVVRRSRSVEDPLRTEPFGRLPYDETTVVATDDGIRLHVEVVEPEADLGDDPLTLVFVHGFCLDQGTFHFQRKALDPQLSPDVVDRLKPYRMVFYDQPGHGLSSRLDSGDYDLTSLGDALRDVIAATTPTGRIVLIGHSMGGMAIMAAAERLPDLFAERVAGVVLISTSGGQTDGLRFYGMPEVIGRSTTPLLNLVGGAARVTAPVIDRARQAGTDLAWLLTRRYGFGTDQPSPALVSYVEQMNTRTSVETIARYLRTIHGHARYPALQALAGVPVLVVCGEKDVITPVAHSEEIARLLPHARLVVVPDSGHVVMLEHPDDVNEALIRFLEEL